MREYRIYYADGSIEAVEADDIVEARELAHELWESPISKIVAGEVVMGSDEEDEDDDDCEAEDSGKD